MGNGAWRRFQCPKTRRTDYARRRLKELRSHVPDLPEDALEKTSLRCLSFAVRRVRAGQQTVLKRMDADPAATGDSADNTQAARAVLRELAQPAETSNPPGAEARLNNPSSGRAHFQKSSLLIHSTLQATFASPSFL